MKYNFSKSFGTGSIASLSLVVLALNAAAGTLYVDLNSANPTSPYSDWSTAATNIQDAVDAAGTGDLILVKDGIYQTGGTVVYGALTNRLAVTKPITVQSVNGPAATVIMGYQVPGSTNGDSAVRCAYLANGAVLVGFTLTNGATRSAGDIIKERSGGALWCETNGVVAAISNCVIAGCAAPGYGGGAFAGLLVGCSVTGNACGTGGGACSSVLNGCTLSGNVGTYGGGANSCTLSNCTLTGNLAANSGGGAYACTLSNCVLTSNAAYGAGGKGGGAYISMLYSCALSNNTAASYGGGAYGLVLNSCLLVSNSAPAGGGANYCTLRSCRLINNQATTLYGTGGGATSCTLTNCGLFGNSASWGGGASYGVLVNCTVVGNSASAIGGGLYSVQITNCIAYYNVAPWSPNYYSPTPVTYCCTWPPASGIGNIAAEPQLAGAFHLGANSPCRGAGNPLVASGVDIDGEPWLNPPSIGCDEVSVGSLTGELAVVAQAAHTNVASGFSVDFSGFVDGRSAASRWEFDDATVVSNRPSVSRAWNIPGDHVVALRAYNESNPSGVAATVTVHVVSQPVHYVALNSPAPLAPFNSWTTAATNIQDAVDNATIAGALIWVSNGIYGAGGRVVAGAMSNRLAVSFPVVIQSVNGPGVTLISGNQVPGTTNGDSAMRCVWLTNGAALIGFTLTNGATRDSGDMYHERSAGGVSCATTSVLVSNCVMTGNSASYYAGGISSGTLLDCTLALNSSSGSGGGAAWSTLNRCLLTGNSGAPGGGAYYSLLTNCVLNGNVSTNYKGGAYGGGAYGGTLSGCFLTSNVAMNYGGGAHSATLIDCVLATNSAYFNGGGGVASSKLLNCTLLGNYAWQGGGANGGVLTNCILAGNWATANSGGGGAYSGTLYNCILNGNFAAYGGGAYASTLNNCTVIANYGTNTGGGVYAGTLNNCVLYFNTAPQNANYDTGTNLNYCCTSPLPAGGAGNFISPPLFVDQANGNLRLQSSSPCINAGVNAYAAAAPDLDGNPRISGGAVDVGPYEFQNPASTISYVWLQQFGLPTDGTADTVDSDHDGMNNWQEWRAGTVPTNALSVLQLLSPTNGASGVTVTWQSVVNRNYYLQRSLDLLAQPPFVDVQSNIVGQAGTTSFTDTNAAGPGPFFYRVGVQ